MLREEERVSYLSLAELQLVLLLLPEEPLPVFLLHFRMPKLGRRKVRATVCLTLQIYIHSFSELSIKYYEIDIICEVGMLTVSPELDF